jgi:hypothetical protein
LQQGAGFDPGARLRGAVLQQLVSLGVRDQRRQPPRAQRKDRFRHRGRNDGDRHFEQNGARVTQRGQLVGALGDVARGEVHLGARQHGQRNPGIGQAAVELGDERPNARGEVFVYPVDQVRRRHRQRDAVFGNTPAQSNAGVPVARPVVDAREQMGVQIDQS